MVRTRMIVRAFTSYVYARICESLICPTGRFGWWHDIPVDQGPNKKPKPAPANPRPPWALEKEDIPRMEGITAYLKTPSSWPPVRKFSEVKSFKTSETMLWAGDVGAYFIRHMDIHGDYKDLFIRLVRITQR
jgi:hypothetical protein